MNSLNTSAVLILLSLYNVCQAAPEISLQELGQQKKYNILLLSLDDLRPELGCYGVDYVKSPNLDRIASEGMPLGASQCFHTPSRSLPAVSGPVFHMDMEPHDSSGSRAVIAAQRTTFHNEHRLLEVGLDENRGTRWGGWSILGFVHAQRHVRARPSSGCAGRHGARRRHRGSGVGASIRAIYG